MDEVFQPERPLQVHPLEAPPERAFGLEAASVSWADQRRATRAPWTAELVPTEGQSWSTRQVTKRDTRIQSSLELSVTTPFT